MKKLHVDQIETICHHVLQCDLSDENLESELIDHLCCEIEMCMAEGMSFPEALKEILKKASIPQLKQIGKDVEAIASYRTSLKQDIRRHGLYTIGGVVSLAALVPQLFMYPQLLVLAIGLEGFTWMNFFWLIRKIRQKRKFDRDLLIPQDI